MRSKFALRTFVVAGLLCLSGVGTALAAPPTIEQMLGYRPRQEDVQFTTPGADEIKFCKVEPVKNAKGQIFGWLLVDGRKQAVRRFLDTNGDNKIDVFSYYREGVEIYREIDSNYNDRPDQFRWLNAGGMKWGVDSNEDGRIDAWRMISAEEAAHEAFLAAATRDFDRLKTLFISEAEIRSLRLPQAQAERIRTLQKQAAAKFQSNLSRMPTLNSKAKFKGVDHAVPACIPAETAGAEDTIKYLDRAVTFEGPDGKHDWLHTGEIIQVGLAWRLVDAPGSQEPTTVTPTSQDPELQKLLDAVSELDRKNINLVGGQPLSPAAVRFYLDRVKLIDQILSLVKAEEREAWIKQMVDNLSTVGQADKASLARLSGLRKQIEGAMPGTKLAAYVTYRELWALYAPTNIGPGTPAAQLTKMQEEWNERLSKFVQTYADADDTPEALWQLAMGSEFAGRDEEAKRWYTQIYTKFPDNDMAAKARGAVARLSIVGQPMLLSGLRMNGGTAFDISSLKNKVVVVYYWASYSPVSASDFAIMKQLHSQHSAKGLEFVCVNLDDNPQDAANYLKTHAVPATHLYQAGKGGGLNGSLAVQYGITGLPTMFLIGRDGRVMSRTLQVSDLVTELKKAL